MLRAALWVVVVLGALAALFAVAQVLRVRRAVPPTRYLGLHDGRLAPCRNRPNCVSTDDERPEFHIAAWPFSGSASETQARLRALVAAHPRTRVLRDEPGYLWIEFRSFLFRYPDDVEVVVDEAAHVVRFRSASRVGRSDLGVNRRRMESLRRELEATD